jgi:hypothetical protein
MKGRISKKGMLEYCKLILLKMSFNRRLFIKEYRKTFSYLNAEEQMALKQWLRMIRDGFNNSF